ncbi:MAG: hypothetical protein ACTSR8_06565 [Promethearchaeota archaeon]
MELKERDIRENDALATKTIILIGILTMSAGIFGFFEGYFF